MPAIFVAIGAILLGWSLSNSSDGFKELEVWLPLVIGAVAFVCALVITYKRECEDRNERREIEKRAVERHNEWRESRTIITYTKLPEDDNTNSK